MLRRTLSIALGILATACVPPPQPIAQQLAPSPPLAAAPYQPTLVAQPGLTAAQARSIPVPIPQPPPPVISNCSGQGIATGSDFVQQRTQLLNDLANPTGPVFEPTMVLSSFPLGNGFGSVSGSRFATDLAAAFDAAPPFFKEQLCGLDSVFVNLDGCASSLNCSGADQLASSWGLRRTLGTQVGRYVSLSGGLWNGGSHALPYSAYETMLLNELLGWPSTVSGAPNFPAVGTDPDTATMTILAALAHEFGHVLWWDVNSAAPNNFCVGGGNSFFSGSWRDPIDSPPMWREFGDPQGEHKRHPQSDDVQVAQLMAAMARGEYDQASEYVFRIYAPDNGPINGHPKNGRWASLFAAFSPDEDFVETFKLDVLLQANPQLRNLTIQFPRQGNMTFNIPATIAQRAELKRKARCF